MPTILSRQMGHFWTLFAHSLQQTKWRHGRKRTPTFSSKQIRQVMFCRYSSVFCFIVSMSWTVSSTCFVFFFRFLCLRGAWASDSSSVLSLSLFVFDGSIGVSLLSSDWKTRSSKISAFISSAMILNFYTVMEVVEIYAYYTVLQFCT